MIKGIYWPNVLDRSDLCEANKVMDFNFVFAHMYCADILVDAKVHRNVRAAAFSLLDDKHFELFKRRIDNKFFCYYDRCDDVTFPKHLLDNDACCHHFINDAMRVVECVKSVETVSAGVNVIVLLPYLKQLQTALKMLGDAFKCCAKTINGLLLYVNDLLSHCLLCADKIQAATRTLQVMNLFLDTDTLYECDLCKEISTDQRFIKPKECCQYTICNACCVTLWKTASTHAKCPACNTSFKSS
ncbi:immediate early protein 0 [Anticarsia gemmatalis multiple nucleopolyhedrovirus]|uniref:Immediate early protein 0 n=1 Tax=Anticarsia gemmatalis multiple nucleopolyhedrovirus TaxID=268591 RepID=A0A0S3IZS1_9ABAC|nr:immediate early protein 0 [Anticarsia gemmatalis multiple nucleopolyhedrovirus]ALR70927.1 immediate early protein 0 [Anticarsia gemmatalis multiple nucleopolyhedrovirus]ALR71556.1 immediate early protein 0 [Anticarsia gemmatalis multiple nucleopolyhedrovirus]